MEYVQGRTLAEILKTNKRLTAKQAAEIAGPRSRLVPVSPTRPVSPTATSSPPTS